MLPAGLVKFKAGLRCRTHNNSLCRTVAFQLKHYSRHLEDQYSSEEKVKILEVINKADVEALSGYDVTKARLKKFSSWMTNNGHIKSLADVETAEGFTKNTAKRLFDSILEGPVDKSKSTSKIKGQVLDPALSAEVRKNCKTVLSIFVTVNSVCWTLIDRARYEVTQWHYYPIHHPEGKKLKLTDIVELSWRITSQLPSADVYVMRAEATTLRAAGSDPNNPKVIAVNLQKAQIVAMIVALVNARSLSEELSGDEKDQSAFRHSVYFLRPTLPYRLYGTLVGKEKVSTDQTVEMLLQNIPQTPAPSRTPQVYISERLKSMFRSQKDLQKDMLGHCLLLGLTFMDVCVYNNQDSIEKLLKRDE